MRFIRLDSQNTVIAIRQAETIVEGEIQSDTGELSQIMQSDGTFVTPAPVPQPTSITLDELQANQIILMDVLGTLFESMLVKGTV